MFAQEVEGTAGTNPVPTIMSYDEMEPFAVVFGFTQGPDTVVDWVFSRELLHDAILSGESGQGDIRFETQDDNLLMTLNPRDDDRLTISFKRDEVARFLEMTEAMVAFGDEAQSIDIESEWQKWVEHGSE